MNVVCYERGLLWVVCYEQVCFERTPPLTAVAKIKKKHFLAHLMLFFMFCGIFSINAIYYSLVIRWVYQHWILAVEVKNSAKITLFSLNTTAVFRHDVMVSANDVLEVGYCTVPSSWGALVGLVPPNKAPRSPYWDTKHCTLMELLSNLNVKPHCTNVKPPTQT